MHQRLHVAVLKAQVMSTKTTTPGTDGNLILLDNCCNIQVSNQRSLLHDIVPNTDSTANTLGGGYKPTMKGNSLHIGCALYDPEAGVTVLSYKRMLDEGRVYHDEAEENFYLTFPSIPGDFVLRFKWIEGILAADVRPLVHRIQELESTSQIMATTSTVKVVGEHWTATQMDQPSTILEHFKLIPNMSKAQVHRLDQVHQAVKSMWSPSKEDLKLRIRNEMCEVPFTAEDVDAYFKMYSHDLNALKGRSQDEAATHLSMLPSLDDHQVLLSGDIMETAGKIHLVVVMVSPKKNAQIDNIFGVQLDDKSAASVSAAVIMVGEHVQSRHGYQIGGVEFDEDSAIKYSKDLIESAINTKVQQVSTKACFAESAIKLIKQRVRIKLSACVYDMNDTILTHMIMGAILVINRTVRSGNGKRSAFSMLNPNTPVNYKSFYAFSPSDLVEVHIHSDNNVLHYRTCTAVPLHPVVDNDNDWMFYSLETGEVFIRNFKKAYKMPWSYEARMRMRYLASQDPVRRDATILLNPTPSVPVLRYEMPKRRPRRSKQRTEHVPSLTEAEVAAESPDPIVSNALNPVIQDLASSFLDSDNSLYYDESLIFGQIDDSTRPEQSHFVQHAGVYASICPVVEFSTSEAKNVIGQLHSTRISTPEMESVSEDGETIRYMNDFSHLPGSIMVLHGNSTSDEVAFDENSATMVQYSGALDGYVFAIQVTAKKAHSTFGQAGSNAIRDEIQSLLRKKVFSAVVKSNLSDSQRKKIIRMSCFVRDKRDANGNLLKIKARLVAGGHMQDRSIYSSEQTSSPTVATSSVFSVISTGVSEGRKFLKFDISTAYLNAEMPKEDEVYMTLDPEMTQILIDNDEEGSFRKALQDENWKDGRSTVKLEKALYGCIQSAKLWYNHLSRFLQRIGFTPNPVDPCVFNRMSSSGKQLTLAIHVDDGLATCVDEDELVKLDQQIRKEFNNEIESEVDCTKFDYLGVNIDVSSGVEAELTMEQYIKDVCVEHGVYCAAPTPAKLNLFDADEDDEALPSKEKDKFHRAVAQLLYLATRVRPDVLLPITFLCSRVSDPTINDQEKLHRVLKYLYGTPTLGIVLGKYGEEMGLTVYADASYAVHKDYKSHGGVIVIHNRGPVLVKCSKQKMVTKSSTEAELVTLSDAASIAAYNVQFLKCQGYNVDATLKQDNTSTIKLAENGRSNSDRTRHIGIRYFFIKQYLEDGTMRIEHCPTKEMLADILTKPLVGEQFRILRDMLLGYK